MTSVMYSKRPGTSGIRGQFYETKLISLINFRLKHNVNITEFALATNMDNIGIFDDICLKFKVKTLDKPLAVFIQAKHRENDILLKNDWATYFDSYMKIKQTFKPTNTDLIFKGQYDEIECFFVIYTTARGDNHNETFDSPYASPLNDVIGTAAEGGQHTTVKNKDVEFLYKIIIKEQVTQLAKPIAKLFFDEVTDYQMFMNNEYVFNYHVILAQSFCEVSDIQTGRCRLANVRQEFFDTDDENLIAFKSSLYKEVIKKRRVRDSEFKTLVALFFNNPTDVSILSKVIGCIITYKNGKLDFVLNNKMINDDFKRQLRKVHIPDVTLDHAVEIAGREILTSKPNFKVPAAFGNKDVIVSKDERLIYLAFKISSLIGKSDRNHVITIDESVDKGFLKLNGGIASAVGNLLVLDENSKMLKFNENIQELGDVAKRLLTTIKQNEINNLNKYRIDVKIKTFPKLTFDCGEHEKKVVQDFFNRVLFYTNQADENDTGKILEQEIKIYKSRWLVDRKSSILTHLVFLKYHDSIQNWWMSPNKALYLTEKNDIYNDAMKTVVSEPPLTVMNKMYEMKTKEANLTFNYNVMDTLELNHEPGYIVITESILLTLYKVKQYLQRRDHVVLDLKYASELPQSDFETLSTELENINKNKIIIVAFSSISIPPRKRLEIISKKLKNKLTIIIIESERLEMVKFIFSEAFNIVNDDKTNLTHLTEDTQHSILQKKIRFQGQEIKLKSIVDGISKSFIEGDVLSKIIHNETILLGEATDILNFDIAKNMYIGRRVCRNKKRDLPVMRIQTEDDTLIRLKHLQYTTCTTQLKEKNTYSLMSQLDQQQQESLHIDTLHDIDDDVVVLTTKPGMGKSTLFTHLFLQTKKVDQTMWIVRINLIEHCRQFSRWKQNKTVIDILECIKFICIAILGQTHHDVTFSLQKINNELSLDHCAGDELLIFELRMFLHFYNRKKVIFLFDGLDEIWPNYADEVLTLLKILKTYPKYIKHKIWITSRPHANINTILEKEFDVSYDLENYSWIEQNMFLYMFWIKNEILLNNNETQLENIYDFINFMSQSPDINLFLQNNKPSELNEHPHLSVYINFICYLQVELRSAPPRIMTALSALYDRCLAYITFINDFITTPLNLYLIAHYFLNEIKGTRKRSENWHFEINPFTFYVNFLNNKLKSIRLKCLEVAYQIRALLSSSNPTEYDKLKSIRLRCMEIYIEDYQIPRHESNDTYHTKVVFYDSKQNYEIHKQLAAYTIFHRNLFTFYEMQHIQEFIKMLKYGNQKTGIIRNVVNNIPIFIHDTIAEYLAAEFVCDKVKKYNMNPKFILDVLDERPSLKRMFEEHLKVNSESKAFVDTNKKEVDITEQINKRMKLN